MGVKKVKSGWPLADPVSNFRGGVVDFLNRRALFRVLWLMGNLLVLLHLVRGVLLFRIRSHQIKHTQEKTRHVFDLFFSVSLSLAFCMSGFAERASPPSSQFSS